MAPRGERGSERGGGWRQETPIHCVRCATQACGETCAFLWQLPLLFSPHGWPPVTATSQDLQPRTARASSPVCGAGTRRDRRLPPSPPRSQTAAGLPGCRQHGCHFVEEKKNPYRFNGLRGFLREKANKNGIRVVYASFSDLYGRIRGAARARWTRRIISAVIPRRVFPWRVALIISSRAAAAATWPDGSHRAEEVEAHTGSYLFIQRHYETRDNFTRVVPADILTLQARFWQTTQTPKWVLQCQVIVVYPFLLQAMKQTQAVCKKKKKKTVWKTSTHDVDAHYQKLGALEEII